jgi:prephenate dehydrogenase
VSRVLDRVAIVGVGLIGASFAAAGRDAGLWRESVGIGRNAANLDRAVADGWIDEGTTDLEYALRDASLVVLAAPVDSCVDLLPAVAEQAAPDALVTDVGSVKVPVVEAAARAGVGKRFVGAHPMAGGTATGAAAADPALFRGCVVAVTPGATSSADRIDAVERLWSAVGAEPLRMSAADHDRSVAATSHLAQIVAFALAAGIGRDADVSELERLAGNGLRDTTRIAASDASVWEPILRLNRANILAVLDGFDEAWSELRRAIEAGDKDALFRVVADAHALRRKLTRSSR